MSEVVSPSESDGQGEPLATADQAQDLVTEVDRITQNVRLSPGLKGVNHNTAPRKTCAQGGVLFTRYPEGETSRDDPSVIKLAEVGWGNPDGTTTGYAVELTFNGPQLTRHVYPASLGDITWEYGDSGRVRAVFDTQAHLASLHNDQADRVQERARGGHLATYAEAVDLFTRLEPLQPAPASPF